MRKFCIKCVFCLCALIVVGYVTEAGAQTTKRFRLGYFEGGEYPVHSVLRSEFHNQLKLLLPEGYDFAFVPEGYRSVGWKRDSCRVMAQELAAVETVDMIVAVGPWVVEDLLRAGFTKPILAMHQFDPVAQGLVGDDGRPVTSNLTVHIRPGKVEDDLLTLTRIVKVKRLGVLYFPSSEEGAKVISAIDSVGKKLGFEVITAEGYDNYGTYAFFKAYRQLDKKIDALYLPPLWGMNAVKVEQFFKMAANDRIPAFTSEAKDQVESGAFGSNAAYSIVSDAIYNAFKAVRIMQGELPADQPIEFRGGTALAINEHAAHQCGVTLSTEILNEAYLVVAPLSEDVPFYSLKEAIDRVLSYNPGYLAKHDAVEAAIQEGKQAYSSYLPQLVASASVAHLDDNSVANSGGRLESDRYQSSLHLHQTVFSAEAIKTIQLAAKQKNLERINLRQTRLDLELAVTAAYLNYLSALELLETHRQYRDLIDRNLEVAGTRLLLGEWARIDLLRFQDERHKASSRIIHAYKSVKVAAVLLNVLFNLPGNSLFVLDTLLFSEGSFWYDHTRLRSLVPVSDTQMQLQDFLVKRALQSNPVMRSFDVGIAIQKDLLSKNTARFYPKLDFQAALWYAGDLVNTPPVLSELNTTWSVWGGVTFPLFLGTDRFRERSKFKARLSQVEFDKDAASLDVMGKVHSGMYDLMSQTDEVPRAMRSAELAAENAKLVSDAYEAGRRDLVDILDALENMLDTRVSSIAKRYGYYLAMARLIHDLGLSTYEHGTTFREEFFRQVEEFQNR